MTYKIGFPRMGETYIGFAKLVELFGYDLALPDALSKKTIRLGVQHSPEYACWPFKISLGSTIEALEAGAEVIGTLGGSGPCRAGWYGELQRLILVEDLGFDIPHFYPMYHLNDVFKIAELGGTKSRYRALKCVKYAWDTMRTAEYFEKIAIKQRCREVNIGETTKVQNEVMKMLTETYEPAKLKQAKKKGTAMFESIETDKKMKPLKVGTVGEIFVVIDPFANLEIEKKLGNLGIEVDRSLYLTDWIWRELVMDYHPVTGYFAKKYLHDNAHGYLHEPVGGDALEGIAWINLYKEKGYDGVIEIGPFTCIPEIVTKSIIPTMSRDLDMPVQTYNIDEHTGEAGFITRLEAFGDLLSQRRDGVPLPTRDPVTGRFSSADFGAVEGKA